MANSQSKHNPKQLQVLGYVYDAVARLLPTEGRDFSTQVKFAGGGTQPSIIVIGLTPLGSIFAKFCMANIQEEIKSLINQESMQVTLPAGSEIQPKEEESNGEKHEEREERKLDIEGIDRAIQPHRDLIDRINLRPNIGIRTKSNGKPGNNNAESGQGAATKSDAVSRQKRVL